jgi:hypothetical protein
MKRHQGKITIRSSQMPGHTGTVVCLFLPFETGHPVTETSPI